MATRRRRRNPQGDAEVGELVAYVTSGAGMGRVYDAMSKNYGNRVLKGTYNHTLAVKGWRGVVNRAAIAYAKEYGMSPSDFTSAYRQRAAEELAKYWEDNTQVKVNPAPRRNPGKAKRARRAGFRTLLRVKGIRRVKGGLSKAAVARREYASASSAARRNPGAPTYSKAKAMKEARALRAKGHTVKVWKRWEGNHEIYWVSVVTKRRAA